MVQLGTGCFGAPFTVRCAIPGCRRSKRGYLTGDWGGGHFVNKHGETLADLRNVDFVCREHGINSSEESMRWLEPDES